MAEDSKIQWTDHTGGPWLICTEVSPGCAKCYARELMLNRLAPMVRKAYQKAGWADWETRAVWGKTAPRVLTKGFWNEARRMDKAAAKAGVRKRMFPSLIDWLDDLAPGIIDQDGNTLDRAKVMADFCDVMRTTTHLDWLLLSKRPESWRERIVAAFDYLTEERQELCDWLRLWLEGKPPANVWIGSTVENQEQAFARVPEMLMIPAKVHFLSVEPLLEAVDLTDIRDDSFWLNALTGTTHCDGRNEPITKENKVDWVIVGGESGPEARPCNVAWIAKVVEDCQRSSVPVFVKQMGAVVIDRNDAGFDGEFCDTWPMGTETNDTFVDPSVYQGKPVRVLLRHPKGGDMAEWPLELRVQQYPSGV